MSNRPTIYMAMEAINHDDELDTSEKNVLRAMLRYASLKTGECFPSIITLARDLGMTDRGVQKIIARIVEKGRLFVIFRSKGGVSRATGRGIPNRWRLNLRLSPGKRYRETPNGSANNPEPQRSNPEPENGQPRTVFGQTTMNIPREEAIKQPYANGSLSLDGHGKTGQTGSENDTQRTLRSALIACGVQGFNLELLTNSRLTADDVRREWKTIQYRKDIKRKPAVLVHRLKAKCGVTLADDYATNTGASAVREVLRHWNTRVDRSFESR